MNSVLIPDPPQCSDSISVPPVDIVIDGPTFILNGRPFSDALTLEALIECIGAPDESRNGTENHLPTHHDWNDLKISAMTVVRSSKVYVQSLYLNWFENFITPEEKQGIDSLPRRIEIDGRPLLYQDDRRPLDPTIIGPSIGNLLNLDHRQFLGLDRKREFDSVLEWLRGSSVELPHFQNIHFYESKVAAFQSAQLNYRTVAGEFDLHRKARLCESGLDSIRLGLSDSKIHHIRFRFGVPKKFVHGIEHAIRSEIVTCNAPIDLGNQLSRMLEALIPDAQSVAGKADVTFKWDLMSRYCSPFENLRQILREKIKAGVPNPFFNGLLRFGVGLLPLAYLFLPLIGIIFLAKWALENLIVPLISYIADGIFHLPHTIPQYFDSKDEAILNEILGPITIFVLIFVVPVLTYLSARKANRKGAEELETSFLSLTRFAISHLGVSRFEHWLEAEMAHEFREYQRGGPFKEKAHVRHSAIQHLQTLYQTPSFQKRLLLTDTGMHTDLSTNFYVKGFKEEIGSHSAKTLLWVGTALCVIGAIAAAIYFLVAGFFGSVGA